MIIIYDCNDSGQYSKTKIMIVIDDPSQLWPQLVSSITIISDAPNCGVTYDCHHDDRNSFIIQATGAKIIKLSTSLFYKFS
jgi:hypothetical protein